MNNRFAVINFSPNLNIRRRTIKLRQLKAMFTFTTLRLHLHTIEYRMPLRGEFRLEIFQFPYWLSNPKFRPPALSFGAQKKFRSESLTVYAQWFGYSALSNLSTFWCFLENNIFQQCMKPVANGHKCPRFLCLENSKNIQPFLSDFRRFHASMNWS